MTPRSFSDSPPPSPLWHDGMGIFFDESVESPKPEPLYECQPLKVWDLVIALVFVALVLVWFGGLL